MENKRHTGVLLVLVLLIIIVAVLIWFFAKSSPEALPVAENESSESYTLESGSGYGVQVLEDEELGTYLAGPTGMTLYATTRNECIGDCLEGWLPYMVATTEESDGPVNSVKRANAYQQTYNGVPLYYYRLDAEEGDLKGHTMDGEWFIARP